MSGTKILFPIGTGAGGDFVKCIAVFDGYRWQVKNWKQSRSQEIMLGPMDGARGKI